MAQTGLILQSTLKRSCEPNKKYLFLTWGSNLQKKNFYKHHIREIEVQNLKIAR